ncbi:hypothetical protein ACB377_07765 [Klebsiella michiganensis]
MVAEKIVESEGNTPSRWRRAASALGWIAGILLLGGCATGLGIFLAENEVDMASWMQQFRGPLFLWRLALYGVVAAMWLHRVRAALLRQVSSPWMIYRLEVMMVCLALLIEFTSYRWGM